MQSVVQVTRTDEQAHTTQQHYSQQQMTNWLNFARLHTEPVVCDMSSYRLFSDFIKYTASVRDWHPIFIHRFNHFPKDTMLPTDCSASLIRVKCKFWPINYLSWNWGSMFHRKNLKQNKYFNAEQKVLKMLARYCNICVKMTNEYTEYKYYALQYNLVPMLKMRV